jgi:hypothetical protein
MRAKQAKQLIRAVQDSSYTPNAWELSFMSSMMHKNDGLILSEKQESAVNNLYAKSSGGSDWQRREII